MLLQLPVTPATQEDHEFKINRGNLGSPYVRIKRAVDVVHCKALDFFPSAAKKDLRGVKSQTTGSEKVFAIHKTDRGLMENIKRTSTNKDNLMESWMRIELYQRVADTFMKKGLNIVRCHYRPIRKKILKILRVNNN